MKKMALIIPYRNRKEHLDRFLEKFPGRLNTLCPGLPFHLFVIEQGNEKPFNKGKLLNFGFTITQSDFDYFCFHDVDMLPTQADYSYPDVPTHLAADVSQFREWMGNGLAYRYYFGGVVLFNKQDFIHVNGYSNQYWGYGSEDDDMLVRVVESGLKWIRRPGVYESFPHPFGGGTPEHQANKERLIRILKNEETDPTGLSDLSYQILDKQILATHTHYLIDV